MSLIHDFTTLAFKFKHEIRFLVSKMPVFSFHFGFLPVPPFENFI